MKYRVSLNDSMDLVVVADSEVEAVRKAKTVKDALSTFVKDGVAADVVSAVKRQYPSATVSGVYYNESAPRRF